MTRPTVEEVLSYRRHVDAAMMVLFERASATQRLAFEEMAELGLHHEQQHQELILTDIKHAFSCNPLLPCYAPAVTVRTQSAAPLGWVDYAGGIVPIGQRGVRRRGGPRRTVSRSTMKGRAIWSCSRPIGSLRG